MQKINKKCKVFLLSGFLGSGKTTMLKQLLSSLPNGDKAAVLMNEFGKAGVDGDVIRRNGLEIIEISRGSIFCACAKGDFLQGLYTIFRDHAPALLLIEASGAADTTDMEKDFKNTMLKGFYLFAGNICVIDAQRFQECLGSFSAVMKQTKAASHIIINKTDLVSAEELDKLDKHIREINPQAGITHAIFGNVPWSVFMKHEDKSETADGLPLPEEWEQFIQAALGDMSRHLAPPDRLSSQSIFWEGDPAKFREIIEYDLPGDIIRSKGYFADTDGQWKVFDIVGGAMPEYSLPEKGFSMDRNLAIFIRTIRARKELPNLFQAKGLKLLEVRF
ncbi:MAG: GTP-binding protein [Synergistaceae bacterium]|nr:GTP-binding protein [Synergistaceae bacterium]